MCSFRPVLCYRLFWIFCYAYRKIIKKKLSPQKKTGFAGRRMGGGGAKKCTDRSVTFRFLFLLTPSLTEAAQKSSSRNDLAIKTRTFFCGYPLSNWATNKRLEGGGGCKGLTTKEKRSFSKKARKSGSLKVSN